MAGEDDSAGARKVPLDMGEGSRKESTGDTLNNATESVFFFFFFFFFLDN